MPLADFTRSAAICQVISGGAAGLLEILVNHPLDVVKTRVQLQRTHAKPEEILYHGVSNCFVKIYRHEGLGGFYKGIMPPILCETPKRAFKFFLFEQSQRFFMFGETKRSAMTFALSGAFSGTMESVFQNPFEVVKITQQSNRHGHERTLTVARQIVDKDGFGLKGLSKGITATMSRNAVFHFFFFGFYYGMKQKLPPGKTAFWDVLQRSTLACLAGILGTLAAAPFDLVKSRIQGPQPITGKIKYEWTLRTIQTVYREEGFFALYKGVCPSLMRVGPGGPIILLAYEYGFDYCIKKIFS